MWLLLCRFVLNCTVVDVIIQSTVYRDVCGWWVARKQRVSALDTVTVEDVVRWMIEDESLRRAELRAEQSQQTCSFSSGIERL